MDDADVAAALIETARTAALFRHQQQRAKVTVPSALLCATCGERIPDARRAAVPGTQFCIHCARHLERGGHHHTER